MNTRKLTTMGIMGALSIVLVTLIHFPIFPGAAFLEYDPADIPILITTFAFGSVAGIILTAIVSIIQGVTVSAAGGVYGIIMHIISTSTYVLVAGCIYKAKKTRKGAVIALVCGTIAMGIVMIIANILITPYFMGVSVDAVISMILPIILPFNLIKAGGNGFFTFVLYKYISGIIKQHNQENRL